MKVLLFPFCNFFNLNKAPIVRSVVVMTTW